jgi:transcription initiation factor TFIID subunit 13
MEPRARIGRNRGQQNFSDQELQQFLFAHGDTNPSLPSTRKVLDEVVTDFIVDLCFEIARYVFTTGGIELH